ncbi:hypothetical protein C8R46DRAFT_1076747 [Mycena filopes]|nr:hypothetical protein C8R46DRAFT_1076747 [Mycena filopes]
MSQPDIPPELWTKILGHLPYGRSHLSAVAAVSRSFRALAVPHLFAEFRFHPGEAAERLTSGTRFQALLTRLAFWSSAAVAPHVRRCFISLWYTTVRLDSKSYAPVGAALFEAVSKFENLRLLSCNISTAVELPALRIERLAHLERLQIHGSQMQFPDSPATYRLQVPHFAYTNIPRLNTLQRSALTLLDPACLRSLEVSAGWNDARDVAHFLGEKTALLSAFHRLHTLRITFRDVDLTVLLACIAPLPALRDLTVKVTGGTVTSGRGGR